MIRRAALAVVLCGLSAPAFATEWTICTDSSGDVGFSLLLGTPGGELGFGLLLGKGDMISIAAMTITVGDQMWVTDPAYGEGTPTSAGQAFEDAETIRIDATDAQFWKFAEMRLFKATEGDERVMGGTLRVQGTGAWAVTCTQ